MHAPVVFFGGRYTFWISRLVVWFQAAVIAWAWVSIAGRLSATRLRPGGKLLLTSVVFAATIHNLPPVAWNTADGLLLSSIGILLCLRPGETGKFSGYVLLGLAVLCKQSFVFMPPLVLIILGDWRRPKLWAATFLPGFAYVALMFSVGGLPEAVRQMAARRGLITVGFIRYLNLYVLSGVIYQLVVMWLTWNRPGTSSDKDDPHTRNIRALLLHGGAWAAVVISLCTGAMYIGAFFLFGMAMGAVLYLLKRGDSGARGLLRLLALALLVAWSVSLSEGYNTPALAAGALLISLFAATGPYLPPGVRDRRRLIPVAAACLTLLVWGVGRTVFVYRDRPARFLSRSLGDVFPGGSMIMTNPNTFEFLEELRNTAASLEGEGKRYCIIPDVPGYWTQARQPNPLQIAWPHWAEISNQRNFERVVGALESGRDSTVVIVQKVDATTLSDGFKPLPENQYYAVVAYVRHHFTRVGETKFFELYR
jgi:hypothetical protein